MISIMNIICNFARKMERRVLPALNLQADNAFDSETQERTVVYQALYGERAYWVRPEKMFFEKVMRDGKDI